jgi:hypothetical protein
MRTLFIRTCVVVVCLLSFVGLADAAPFVNLDFEQSTVQPGDPLVVPTSAAFPGWTARINGQTLSGVYHDYTGAGEPIVAIWDQPVVNVAFLLLEGSFMAYLKTGTNGFPGTISQIGDVPNGTKSLRLTCDGQQGPPTVRVNGSELPMVFISGIHAPRERAIYGGDISPFAGGTVELEFRSRTDLMFAPRQAFDAIEFSPMAIPEPSQIITAMVGFIALHPRWGNRPRLLNGNQNEEDPRSCR